MARNPLLSFKHRKASVHSFSRETQLLGNETPGAVEQRSWTATGTQYVASPLTATRSFGLPLPGNDVNIASWLRLNGVRDIVAGLAVLALMWSTLRGVGIILLVEAIIPVCNILILLAAKGSTNGAFGTHGPTAVLRRRPRTRHTILLISTVGMSVDCDTGGPKYPTTLDREHAVATFLLLDAPLWSWLAGDEWNALR